MSRALSLFLSAALALAPLALDAKPEKKSKKGQPAEASAAAESTPASESSVVVFRSKSGNSYGGVRIPAVITGKNGRLLAFAEGRATAADQSNNDIILSISDDDGKTWSKADNIAEAGKDCFNNPCPVFDASTGTIFVLFQKYPDGVSERNGKLTAGSSGATVITNWVIESKDNGRSWTKPKDITKTTKPESAKLIAGGPHPGVQLTRGAKKGRLVIPYNEAPEFGKWSVYAVYSDDHGKTWKSGESAENKDGVPNETAVAELSDGDVMINARKWTGAGVRKVAVSGNGGTRFRATENDDALFCNSTQGALLRYSFAEDKASGGKSRLLFSGIGGPKRQDGTVYLSYDEGKTWAHKRMTIPGYFAYSGLVRLANGDIGLIYEATGHTEIRFARITLDWLTDGKDKGK